MDSRKPTDRTRYVPGTASWDDAPLEKRALLKARQGVPYAVFGTDMRVVDENMHDVPADAPYGGRSGDARQQRDAGLLPRAGGHRDRIPRRLVSLRRSGGDASRWLYRGARPRQGHHHLWRREYFLAGGRARAVRASRRPGGGNCRPPRREVGRGAARLRPAEGRRHGHRTGVDRVLPRAPGTLQMPKGGTLRCIAENLDRQDPQERAAPASAAQ